MIFQENADEGNMKKTAVYILLSLFFCTASCSENLFSEKKKQEGSKQPAPSPVDEPVSIAGSWLVCGYLPIVEDAAGPSVGCGAYASGKKVNGSVSDWSVAIASGSNENGVALTQEAADSPWHVAFRLSREFLTQSFEIRASMSYAGQVRSDVLPSSAIRGIGGVVSFQAIASAKTFDSVTITLVLPKETKNFLKVTIREFPGENTPTSCQDGVVVRELPASDGTMEGQSFDRRPEGTDSIYSYLCCVEDLTGSVAPVLSSSGIHVGATDYKFVIDRGSVCGGAFLLVYISELELKWGGQYQANAIAKVDASSGQGTIGGIGTTVTSSNVWSSGNCSGYDCTVWRIFDGDASRTPTRNYASAFNSFSSAAPYNALQPTFFTASLQEPVRLQGYRLTGSNGTPCDPTGYHVEFKDAEGAWTTIPGSAGNSPTYPNAAEITF